MTLWMAWRFYIVDGLLGRWFGNDNDQPGTIDMYVQCRRTPFTYFYQEWRDLVRRFGFLLFGFGLGVFLTREVDGRKPEVHKVVSAVESVGNGSAVLDTRELINKDLDLHELKKGTIQKHPELIIVSEDDETNVKEKESEVVKPSGSATTPKVKTYNFVKGHTTARVNVRKGPGTNYGIYEVINANTNIKFAKYNSKWSIVKYKNKTAYIYTKYISKKKANVKKKTSSSTKSVYAKSVTLKGPSVSGKQKSYMSYRAITARASKQFQLQKKAYTGNYGIRMINGRYLVAVGSHYTKKVGQYLDIVLDNGTVIPCILGDRKADRHTDSSNRYTKHDKSVVEFIVDPSYLPSKVKKMGNISYAKKSWNSGVNKVIVYNKFV